MNIPNPRFEDGRAMLVAGLSCRYASANMNEIPKLWQRFSAYFGKIPGRVGKASYGVCSNVFSGANGFDYLSSVEVSSLSGLPAEFSSVKIPAQVYAVFPHLGHVSEITNTCAEIPNWFKGAGREIAHVAGTPDFFERYGEGFDPETGTGDIEIWVPIKA